MDGREFAHLEIAVLYIAMAMATSGDPVATCGIAEPDPPDYWAPIDSAPIICN